MPIFTVQKRMSRISKKAAGVLALTCISMSSCKKDEAHPCHFDFHGNYTASFDAADGCGVVADAADGGDDWTFKIDLSPSSMGTSQRLSVAIDLAGPPEVGSYTPESVANWRGVAAVTPSVCLFGAGARSIPTGDFSLHLTDVSMVAASGSAVVHGTLHVEEYVQSPSGTDCGPGDTETIDIVF